MSRSVASLNNGRSNTGLRGALSQCLGPLLFVACSVAVLGTIPIEVLADPIRAGTAPQSSTSLLDNVARERRAATQAVEAEVGASLRSARSRLATQPAEVYHDLSLELDRVRKSRDLDAAERARLLAQIRAMMQQASRQASNHSELTLRTNELNAAQNAEAQRLRDITVEQQRAQRALAETSADIQRRQFDAAVESAERAQAWGGAPSASAAAASQARTAGRYAYNAELQRSRNDGYLSSTGSVARSAVPVSDIPGIQYPPPEEWREKTAARERYASTVDMHRVTSGEAKINAALNETSSLDVDQMPLSDVVAYLKARHGIEIQLDRKGLADVNVDSGTLITMHVKGIKLKSILKVLCNDLELVSVRRDDILLITSKEKAEYFIENRVYYVGPEMISPQPIWGGWGVGF